MACAAGVLASQPDLFFLSSALSLTGFGDQLPSPNLPVTVFAPTNNAILGLLNYLSTSPAPSPQCCALGSSMSDRELMKKDWCVCLLILPREFLVWNMILRFCQGKRSLSPPADAWQCHRLVSHATAHCHASQGGWATYCLVRVGRHYHARVWPGSEGLGSGNFMYCLQDVDSHARYVQIWGCWTCCSSRASCRGCCCTRWRWAATAGMPCCSAAASARCSARPKTRPTTSTSPWTL